MSNGKQDDQLDFDPRSVSDDKLRTEYTREQIERWREEAQTQHNRWLDVVGNNYGRD